MFAWISWQIVSKLSSFVRIAGRDRIECLTHRIGRSRLLHTEPLEPRCLLSANFTLSAGGLLLDNFAQVADENLSLGESAGGDYSFVLSEGIWSGTDVPGVIVGNATQTLVVDRATLNPLPGGIDIDLGGINADVSLLSADYGALAGGLDIDEAGIATLPAGEAVVVASFSLDTRQINLLGMLNAVGGPATSVTLASQQQLSVIGGSIVTTNSNVLLRGNPNGTSLGDHSGIALANAASVITNGPGNLTFQGHGGNNPSGGLHAGIIVGAGTALRSTSNAGGGSIALTGTGGQGQDLNVGVLAFGGGVEITSLTGNISIDGTGGAASGASNHGVMIDNAVIRSLGMTPATAAEIAIDGVAGTGTGGNHGVLVQTASALITSRFGDIKLEGEASNAAGNNSSGIALTTAAQVESTGTTAQAAEIELLGKGNANGPGIQIDANVLSVDGPVVVTSDDDIQIGLLGRIRVSFGAVTPANFSVALTADADGVGGGTIDARGNITAPGGLTARLTDLDGLISGIVSDAGRNGGLIKNGPGTLELAGTNTYTGQTVANAGTLLVTGTLAGNAVVNNTARLGGAQSGGGGGGKVNGSVTVNPGGTLAPGLSPGIFNTGNLVLAAGSTLAVEVNGVTPGTQHDQLRVTGTVNLNNATLVATGSIGQTPLGTQIVLISNNGTDPVVGTFAGLANGAVVNVNGQFFQLRYNGGDGNDVVLVQQSSLGGLTVKMNGSTMPIVNENAPAVLSGTFVNTPQAHVVLINWGDGEAESFNLQPGVTDFTVTHRYRDDQPTGTPSDIYQVTVRVTDTAGTVATDNSLFVEVRNVPPTFTSISLTPNVLPLGATGILSGTFADPGVLETFFMDIDWDGDSIFEVENVSVAGGVFSFSHVFDDGLGLRNVRARIRDDDMGQTTATLTATVTGSLQGVHLFYNDSAFDNNGAIVEPSDSAAIAVDKTPLTFGGSGVYANISNYSRGINGIFVDLELPDDGASLDASSFLFRTGNDSFPDQWPVAAAPTAVGVLPNLGSSNSDRAFITFANGAIRNTWLRMTILAGEGTGLTADQDFFFGHAAGESGANLFATLLDVDAIDLKFTANNLTSLQNMGTEPINQRADYNRDRSVNAFDFQVIAQNIGVDVIRYISPVQGVPATAAAPPPSPVPLTGAAHDDFVARNRVFRWIGGQTSRKDLLAPVAPAAAVRRLLAESDYKGLPASDELHVRDLAWDELSRL